MALKLGRPSPLKRLACAHASTAECPDAPELRLPCTLEACAWHGGHREYLAALVGYLESFHERTQPLGALAKVYARLADFDARFDAGEVPVRPTSLRDRPVSALVPHGLRVHFLPA